MRLLRRPGLRLEASLLAAALWIALAADSGHAQNNRRFLQIRIPVSVPRFGRAPVAPLPPAVQERLERARVLRATGNPEAARDTLARLLAAHPHHPMLLVELATAHEDRRSWRAIESLARAERSHANDSLLLAHDLTRALERLGRPKEAMQVVLEAWIAEPLDATWATGWLDTLAVAEPKAVRELVRKAAASQPKRDDLAYAAAKLDWRYGDKAAALRTLAATETADRSPARWSFAEQMLVYGNGPDSAAAVEALVDLAADRSRDLAYRLPAARRAWGVAIRLGRPTAVAERLTRGLKDVPADTWGAELTVPVMRALREGGLKDETRSLLQSLGEQGHAIPEIALEHALGLMREGPPERALQALATLADKVPEARFRYAEALFFSGQPESAAVSYKTVADDPGGAHAGASLERLYLIEDAKGSRGGLIAFGRLAYEQWRGETKRALALADSLHQSLDRGPLWAQASLQLAALQEAAGDGKAALAPLLAVAQQLPDDRLAPLARQRAGDVYRVWYKDDAKALEQYEECLARYPKAWNTPEVRRWVEIMRRDRAVLNRKSS
jgi:thioredoxin-like negative regulator of GroEL